MYGNKSGVHAAIITYLDIKKGDFYKVETTVDGKSFVTARGWSDLSEMIKLYELDGITVDENLIGQYLQNKKIAKEFAVYYDLFNKYKSDYQIDQILAGKEPEDIRERARKAKFDERLSLLGLLLDGVISHLRDIRNEETSLLELLESLKYVRQQAAKPDSDIVSAVDSQIKLKKQKLDVGKRAANISASDELAINTSIKLLESMKSLLLTERPADAASGFKLLKKEYDSRLKDLSKQADQAKKILANVFHFCEDVFADGQEILILVTELTISYYGAHFISRYGCDEYFQHNKGLLFYERQKKLIAEVENLEL